MDFHTNSTHTLLNHSLGQNVVCALLTKLPFKHSEFAYCVEYEEKIQAKSANELQEKTQVFFKQTKQKHPGLTQTHIQSSLPE